MGIFRVLRCATRGPAAQGRIFFFVYPALIPHPGSPGLGNVTGLLSAIPASTGASRVGGCSAAENRGFEPDYRFAECVGLECAPSETWSVKPWPMKSKSNCLKKRVLQPGTNGGKRILKSNPTSVRRTYSEQNSTGQISARRALTRQTSVRQPSTTQTSPRLTSVRPILADLILSLRDLETRTLRQQDSAPRILAVRTWKART